MRTKLIDQIRQAVLGSGLSQYRVCKLTGIGMPGLSRFVRGKAGLSMESLNKLGDCLGLVVVAKPRKKRKR